MFLVRDLAVGISQFWQWRLGSSSKQEQQQKQASKECHRNAKTPPSFFLHNCCRHIKWVFDYA
jgi:hypothetical protein